MPRNLYVRTCVKFTFANKIEAIHKWSLVSVEPLNFSFMLSTFYILFTRSKFTCVRLRANGRNIVDQQLPTLLDVTCCVRLHTLLHVVACCCAKFETGQTFPLMQTDATLLAYNSQCWELLRPFARSLNVRSQKRISGNQP